MEKLLCALSLLTFPVSLAAQKPQPRPAWRQKVAAELPLLGHRNWILVVDSAYPLQTSPGAETIETNSTQVEVLSQIMKDIDHSIQVRPIVYMDAELPFVLDKDAPGASAYREAVRKVLGSRKVEQLPPEQIISRVDEIGKTFHILILKTNMTIPYTSVFLQLNCKYWGDDAESELRARMTAAAKAAH